MFGQNFSKGHNNENYVKNSNDTFSNSQTSNNNNYRNNNYNNNINTNTNTNTNNNESNGPTFNVKLGFDSNTGQVNSIKPDVKMNLNDAKNIYNANKQYLPTKDQIIDGAKTTGKYIEKSGVLESEPIKEKKKDPLTNLFGFGKKK